jgi:signal transduction histidine kinase
MSGSGSGSRSVRRDRVVDVSCVVLASLTTVLFVAGNGDLVQPATGLYFATGVAPSVPPHAALWWRRHRPFRVAVLVLLVGAYTEFAAGASLVAFFTVAVHCRRRVTLVLLALSCASSVPYSLVRPDPALEAEGANAPGQVAAGLVFTIVILLPILLWGWRVRSRRQKVNRLRERAERAEAEAALTAERVRRREREHIAREMHDVLAHRITLLSLHAGALELRPGMGEKEVASVAGTMRATAHQALEDLREILGVLRHNGDAAAIRPQPGVTALPELVGECRAAGVLVVLEDRLPEPGHDSLSSPVSRTAYRVVQEGLTNARKHAPGSEVRIRLDRSGEGERAELHVVVRNALAGAGAAAGPAMPGARSGLVGLSERVSLAGGRIDYGVRRANGDAAGGGSGVDFSLEAWLPWPT